MPHPHHIVSVASGRRCRVDVGCRRFAATDLDKRVHARSCCSAGWPALSSAGREPCQGLPSSKLATPIMANAARCWVCVPNLLCWPWGQLGGLVRRSAFEASTAAVGWQSGWFELGFGLDFTGLDTSTGEAAWPRDGLVSRYKSKLQPSPKSAARLASLCGNLSLGASGPHQ